MWTLKEFVKLKTAKYRKSSKRKLQSTKKFEFDKEIVFVEREVQVSVENKFGGRVVTLRRTLVEWEVLSLKNPIENHFGCGKV